jgi:hypothetical protein
MEPDHRANIHIGEQGYSPELDKDRDGIACERQ